MRVRTLHLELKYIVYSKLQLFIYFKIIIFNYYLFINNLEQLAIVSRPDLEGPNR